MLFLYVLIAIHVAPVLILLALKIISLPYGGVLKELRALEDVDDETKAVAEESFKRAFKLELKTLIFDITAPVVTFYVLMFVKREANELPKPFRYWWDNNVSLNGDGWWVVRGDQVIDLRDMDWNDVKPTDILVSYNELNPLGNAYYARRHKPRDFMARWRFIGWRNRASLLAKNLGPLIESRPVIVSGQRKIDRDNPGYLLIRYKDFIHFKSLVKIGPIVRIRSYGYKLEYALQWNDGVVDKVPAIATGLSFKSGKNLWQNLKQQIKNRINAILKKR